MNENEQMSVVLGTVAMEPKGEYNSSTYYEKLNTVQYNGSTYMAKEAVQGETPSTSDKWQFVAGGLRVEDIVDNLESTATDKPLSANQGKTLKRLVKDTQENVRYIFEKAITTSGDCNIIKYKNKNIVIDTHSSSQWSLIKQMLDDNEVTHIDYLIITHYHADHVGNFDNLYNNSYIDTNTLYYMPANTTQFGEGNNNAISGYKQKFIDYGLTYYVPEEGEVLTVEDDLELTFFNCDGEALDNYYPHASYAVNATSTVVLVEHKGVKSLYMGDGTGACYRRMREEKFIKGTVDLLKIGHHGIDTSTDELFVKNLNPKFAVQTCGKESYGQNSTSLSSQMFMMDKLGTIIYPSQLQSDYVVFESNGSMNNIKGVAFVNGGSIEDYDIYVDSSVERDEYQDGTQDYPYCDLPVALSSIRNYNVANIIVHLADGEYCDIPDFPEPAKLSPTITNYYGRIDIQGNENDKTAVVLKRGVTVYSSNVTIRYLTISTEHGQGIHAEYSKIFVSNCDIVSEADTPTSIAVFVQESLLYLTSTKISNANVGIALRYGSVLTTSNVTFDSINNNNIDNQDINHIVNNSNIFTDSTGKYLDLRHYGNFKKPILIYKDTGADFTIVEASLPVNFSRFDSVEISYRNSNSNFGTTGKIIPSTSGSISITLEDITANGTDLYVANLTFSTAKLTITSQKKISISDSGQVTVTTGNYFKIDKIIGELNAKIDLS